LAFIIRIYRE